MDKAKKNTVIHAAADRMAANYKSSQIPMYGDALRMPNRNAVIEIIRDCQKLIFCHGLSLCIRINAHQAHHTI